MIKKWSSTYKRTKLYQLAAYVAAIIILALFPLFIESTYLFTIFILTLIYIIVASSLRLIITSGQFPLAHAAFMALGGYFSGIVSIHLDLSPWLTIPLGALFAMGVGIFIGYPFSRLKTFYYAMVSLFFGTGVVRAFQSGGKFTGGNMGLTLIPPLFESKSMVAYFYFVLAITVISLFVIYRLEFSRFGQSLKAIDQTDLVAGSVGIDVAKYKITVLAFGCFFAGLAGGIYAHFTMTLSPWSFDMMATLWLFMYVIIGGLSAFEGPIIGTVLLFLIPEFSRGLKIYTPFFTGGLLFLVIYLIPDGLVSLPGVIRSRIKKGKVNGQTIGDS